MAIKLSDFIAKYLKEQHGIDHFFLVSGGGAMHLNDSFGKVFTYTAHHNEQAMAYAAEGYARINQRIALVNPTSGPGGLNCLSGVFGQWTDSVPVIYISGQIKRQTMIGTYPELALRQLGDQEIDIIQSVKHLTKYAHCVTEANEIKYHLDKAIYEATTGRFGPVWLDIPHDIQAATIEENELLEFTPTREQPMDLKLESVINALSKAKRPLIVAGHGVRIANKVKELNELLAKTSIPVVTTFNGFDTIEDANLLYVGRIGTIGQRAGNFALQNADCILFLGTRNNIRQASYNWENYAKNAYKIIIDIDRAELDKPTVQADLAINADLKDFIPALLSEDISLIINEKWLAYCSKVRNDFSFAIKPEQKQDNVAIDPYHFTYTLTKLMKEDDVFIMANGSACVCTFQNAVVKKGQRYILNSGNAAMGFSLSAAIGASYEAKGKDVICLEGDGSIMMNLQEFQTIIENKLSLKLFILNNNGYSSIKQTQQNFFNGNMVGSDSTSGISMPDFVQVAKAFGLKAVQLTNPNIMEEEIKSILLEKNAVVCEVKTIEDYGFAPKLSARTLDDGTMVSPTLEDMFPFINVENYKVKD